MSFQHLADVHSRRNAERVQDDIDRRAVVEVRHVLDRDDRRDHALVTVPAGHLVAGLDPALDREVDLDHLQHARREIVAGGDLRLLLVEAAIELVALRFEAFGRRLELAVRFLVLEADVEPLLARQFVKIDLGDLAA